MKIPLTKPEWIARYGGQELLDSEGLAVVPCGDNCEDSVCHGWRVEPKRPERYYRVDCMDTRLGRELYVEEHQVVKRTAKGVWLDVFGARRFVLASAIKQWASPTPEEALEHFIARKKRQVAILRSQLRHAEEALETGLGRKLPARPTQKLLC